MEEFRPDVINQYLEQLDLKNLIVYA